MSNSATEGLKEHPQLPPVALSQEEHTRDEKMSPVKIAIWVAIALLGGVAWVMLAIVRGETVNAIWFVFAALATYLIGYRFYSKVIERDRKSTRLNSSHVAISYAVFCLKKKKH